MRSLTPAFSTQLKTSGTLAYFLRMVLKDGRKFGFSSFDKPLAFDGVTFKGNNGVTPSAFASTAKIEPGNTAAQLFFSIDLPEADILAGILDNAEMTWFVANWQSPPVDIDATPAGCLVLGVGRVGKVKGNNRGFTAEVLTLSNKLVMDVAISTSPLCRATFGDSDCAATVDQFLGTVTSAVGRLVSFTADVPTARAATVDFCSNGDIEWITGPNLGYGNKIQRHTSGQLQLASVPVKPISVGDRFKARMGCSRALLQCNDRHSNAPNFRGEPHLPGPDALIKSP